MQKQHKGRMSVMKRSGRRRDLAESESAGTGPEEGEDREGERVGSGRTLKREGRAKVRGGGRVR